MSKWILEIPYDYLDVDDPRAQEIIAAGWEDGFLTSIPIRGLVGYTPCSERYGGLAGYLKDREILIEKNVGNGFFQSDKLAVSKESGLIEELGLNKWDISRNDFETSRW